MHVQILFLLLYRPLGGCQGSVVIWLWSPIWVKTWACVSLHKTCRNLLFNHKSVKLLVRQSVLSCLHKPLFNVGHLKNYLASQKNLQFTSSISYCQWSIYSQSVWMCRTMDTISHFIVTSIVLLQALAILRGQNDIVVNAQALHQGKYERMHTHTHTQLRFKH